MTVKLSKTDVADKVCKMIKRLANGDWFTTRVSACGMFATTYPLVRPCACVLVAGACSSCA